MLEDGGLATGQSLAKGEMVVPKDTLRRMLIEENERRLSPEMQAQFAELEQDASYKDWLYAVQDMQVELVNKYGFTGAREERALYELRCAAQLYPEEADFREIPLYVKYNRAKHCDVRVGSVVPDLPLTALDGGDVIGLRSLCEQSLTPTMIMAGSYS